MTGYRHPKSGLSAQCTQGYDVDSLFSLVSVLARARQNRHELRGTFCKIRRFQFAFSEDFTLQNPKIPVCIFRISTAPAPGAVRLTHGTYLINCMRRKHPSARDGKATWQKQVVWFPAKEFGCGIFAPRAAVYSVANKWPHSFHLGFPEFSKSHPSLTPQPEAAFCQNRRRPAARGRFLPEPAPSRSPRPFFARARGRPATRERSCRC